jgi:hypothetical protein
LEGEAQTPFLQSVLDQSSKKPTEIQIAIEPTAEDEYPHAVLQAGTRYGVIVTAPTGLVNQDWGEEKERPVPGFNPLSQATVTKDNIKYDLSEVYKQRKSLAVAVRLRNGYPLAVKQIGRSSSGEIISREALIRGFRHSKKEKGVSYTGATQRVTQALGGGMISPGFGQKGEVEAITEDLIFTPAGDEDEKGLVEVIVFEVVEEEVTELRRTPSAQTASKLALGLDTVTGDQTRDLNRRFLSGEAKFGEPKRTKVEIKGIKDLVPIAAFRMMLIGENPTEELEMRAAKLGA